MRHLTALTASVFLAGCVTAPADPSLPAGAHYVALGSSFAAGAGIPPPAGDRPERCGASQWSYSRLLAARLDLRLTDASCGGATTAHVLEAWDDMPPQIAAVTPTTRLVTITIGGNDLNYMGVLFAASCHAGLRSDRFVDSQTGQCRDIPLPEEPAYAAVEDDLAAVLLAVRERAPQARVVLVQYVALVPEEPCAAAPLLPDHAIAGRELARRLAEASARAAERAGAEVLAIDRLSLGHTACSAEPWASGLGEDYVPARGAPWHPTAEGHAAIADALTALLQRPTGMAPS